MSAPIAKQSTLKPQDLLVALKIAVNSNREFTYPELSNELYMSLSEVHTSVKRAKVCGLLARGSEHIAQKFALQEFLIHGLQYVFPPVNGMLTRGMPTALAGPPLSQHFATGEGLPQVWPTPDGNIQGIGLLPLYPSIPQASSVDLKLYSILTLVDSLRSGKAREREIASSLIMEYMK